MISALIRGTTDEDKTKAFTEIGKRATTILQTSVQNAIKLVLEAKCVSLNTRRALLERAVNVVEVKPFIMCVYLTRFNILWHPSNKKNKNNCHFTDGVPSCSSVWGDKQHSGVSKAGSE